MDGPSPEHPLTRRNLGQLEEQAFLSPASSTDLPDDRLARAKRQVYSFLWSLKKIGTKGEQILHHADLQIVGYDVQYRGARQPPPDLDDPTFWASELQAYERKYTPILRLERVKGRVRAAMISLQSFREGLQALELDDLRITSAGAFLYRGPSDRKPNFENLAYWESRLTYFDDLYNDLFQKCRPRPPPASEFASDSEVEEHKADEVLKDDWNRRQKDIQTWALGQSMPIEFSPSDTLDILHRPDGTGLNAAQKGSLHNLTDAPSHSNSASASKRIKRKNCHSDTLSLQNREIDDRPSKCHKTKRYSGALHTMGKVSGTSCNQQRQMKGTRKAQRENSGILGGQAEPGSQELRRSRRIAGLPKKNYRI
ncbi:hypothetical protein CDEST_14399 [Colletotrichum destructivum]|uniref:Uncharacterized protein n=1 Tax=Colletotrichum destructivum TaxID=34406 RepID=A0AAX4J1W2_9PEZI|nr:hypothetical protein CDEST_14399 [Colletotrichum destructivum]